jgi:adenylosuccinate synthase
MPGKLTVVVGGMLGSEAKGRIAAYLTRPDEYSGPVIAVRVGGSNAGHTVFGTCPVSDEVFAGDRPNECKTDHPASLHPWRLRHVPVAAVTNPDAFLVLAAGSEVDPDVLTREVTELESAGYKVRDRLSVDAQATVVEPRHLQAEAVSYVTRSGAHENEKVVEDPSLIARIGSTGKGIGAARADRAMRKATLWHNLSRSPDDAMGEIVGDSAEWMRFEMDRHDAHVLIEGVQGFGLGQHAGHYPHVTSSDCRAVDFLSMAGLSPWDPAVREFQTWVVVRTRPIRVAGNSGPLEGETTWAELGLPTEYTTVTKKERRVGEWDGELVKRAIRANGGPAVRLAITMLDQLDPASTGATAWTDLSREAKQWLYQRESELGVSPSLVGTGPHTMVDVRYLVP